MQNYDPEFTNIAKPHDILVSGYSFGCGSSREQAATSILAKGITLVIAGSFSNIFSRNSINNVRTPPTHYIFRQADRKHRDNFSVLLCSSQKVNADLENYNRDSSD